MDLILVLIDPVPFTRRRHSSVKSTKCERASREQHNNGHERQQYAGQENLYPFEQCTSRLRAASEPFFLLSFAPL